MKFDYSDLPPLSEVPFTKDMIFLDLETSGFQGAIPDACVLSIGALIMKKSGEIQDEFYAVICPTDYQLLKASKGAYAVNGFSEERLRAEGRPAEEVWGEFADWLKKNKISSTKTRYVGQNPGFDLAFLEEEVPALCKKYGWVRSRATDIIERYGVCESKFIVPFISGKGKRKGKKGNALALALQVEPEPDEHNALEGARLNYRNYTRMAQITRRWDLEGSPLTL